MPKTLISTLALAAVLATTALPALAHPPGGYGDLVEAVAPAVVFIEVTSTLAPARADAEDREFLREFERRFGQRFGDLPDLPRQRAPRQGVGSGFIISADGQIVTNHHVIAGADTVVVRLSDGRSFDAQVVGSDPMTDIAVLQIEAAGDLPSVAFGDSDALRVGQAVVAMGSPFGLGGAVTSGIVSALSRDIHSGPFDDFIQTDAAINRGNSGGPLFNEDGQVIGVNTAIFSPAGGSVGIGFAVPSDLVRDVVADLADDGIIERGWLGVQIKRMSDEVAQALGFDGPRGAVVEKVFPDSPAAAAGLEIGDIILELNGDEITSLRDLPRAVAALSPQSGAALTILRGGERRVIDVTLGLRADQDA